MKRLLLSLLLMASWALNCWAQEHSGPWAERSSGAVFPWFLSQPRSGWQVLGMAFSESLNSAHQEFQQGILKGNFHFSILSFREQLSQSQEPPFEAEALWHIAEGYQRMRHFQEASAYWAQFLRIMPQGSLAIAARAALAESLFQSRELEQALELYRMLIQELEERRGICWALFRGGDCLFYLGEKKEAALWYQRAMKVSSPLGSAPPESLENLTRLALDRGDGREASLMCMTALSLYPEHPRAGSWMLNLARAMKMQSKFFQASLILERLLDKDEGSMESGLARLMLAALGSPCLKQAGLFPAAHGMDEPETLKRFLFNQNPQDRELQLALGELAECWSSSGKTMEAWEILESFNKGLDEDSVWPEFRKAAYKTGAALVAQATDSNRLEPAMEAFHWMAERIAGLWNDPTLLLNGARVHERLGFFGTAADLYSRARVLVGLGPRAQEAALGLIRSHLAAGRLQEAFKALQKEPSLGALKGKEASVLEWASKVSSPKGYEVAARFLQEISSGRPTLEASKSLGLLSLESKVCAPGAELLALGLEAVEEQENHSVAEAQVLMGDLLDCAGKKQEALKWYERVARRSEWGDTEKWAALRMAQLQFAEKSHKASLPYLERLAKEPPGSPWRVLAEELKQGKTLGENFSRKGSS